MKRRLGVRYRIGYAAIAAAVVIAAGAWAARVIPDQLEAMTGETETRFQVVSLVSSMSEPALSLAPDTSLRTESIPLGVNVFLEQEVEEWKLRKTFDLLKAAGVTWIRQEIPWSDIEVNGKGDFSNEFGSAWAKYDRFIDLAYQYHIQILARLDSPPNWTRTDNRVHNRPPDDLNDYGDFVATFAERYRGKISYLQIWNEPNIFPEWGWQEVDPVGYAALLKIASTRAKAANPDIVIVAAALSPTDGTADGYNENDIVYLQKMYDAGAAPYFDVMSAMGYSPWTGPGDRRAETDRVNFSRVQLIRDAMVRNGDSDKSLWVSELGWNALPDGFPLPPTHGKVTRERQAQYLQDAYTRAENEWPWLGVIFTWHLRMVHDENRDQVMYYFGLADADFTLHPAYFTLQSLASGPRVLNPGRKSESHPAIGVSDGWQYAEESRSDGYFLRSNTPGDNIAFLFNGTDLQLVLHRGPGLGKIKVAVDGKPASSLPDGVLDLATTDDLWQETVAVSQGLAAGVHRADITVVSGQVDFDGTVIHRDNPSFGTLAIPVTVGMVTGTAVLWSLSGLLFSHLGALLLSLRRPRLRRPSWPRPVFVTIPPELYREVSRDVPKDRRPSFIAAAVAEALRRLREGPDTGESEEYEEAVSQGRQEARRP